MVDKDAISGLHNGRFPRLLRKITAKESYGEEETCFSIGSGSIFDLMMRGRGERNDPNK